jgi:phenylalanyl-tRNA synthetase beta chain
VFLPPKGVGPLPDERDRVGALLAGFVRRRPREDDRAVDGFDLVDVWNGLVEALHLADARLAPGEWPSLHPGRTALAIVDGDVVGALGDLAPEVAARFSLTVPVVAMELELDRLLDARRTPARLRPVSRFPASGIDLAFVVDESVAAARVAETLREAAGDLLEDVSLFDVFRSGSLGPSRKSLAFALEFRAADRTLTDADVAEVRARAIDAVVAAHDAELRG